MISFEPDSEGGEGKILEGRGICLIRWWVGTDADKLLDLALLHALLELALLGRVEAA